MPLNIQDVRTIEKHFKNPPKPIFFHNQFFCPLQRYPNDENAPQIQLQQHHPPVAKEVVTSPHAIYPEECPAANGNSIANNVQCDGDFPTINCSVEAGDNNKAISGADTNVGNNDCDRTTNNSNINNSNAVNCNNNNNNSRPAVVILSGNGDKEVSGITFGFDINEQLLSDDVCADFLARFVPPKDCDITNGFNLDKIVNFIGIAWEDIITETNGTVKYYTDEL